MALLANIRQEALSQREGLSPTRILRNHQAHRATPCAGQTGCSPVPQTSLSAGEMQLLYDFPLFMYLLKVLHTSLRWRNNQANSYLVKTGTWCLCHPSRDGSNQYGWCQVINQMPFNSPAELRTHYSTESMSYNQYCY